MKLHADNIVILLLNDAEARQRCVFAHAPNIRRMLRTRFDKGLLVMPFEGIFARPSYWNALSKPEQSLHILRTLNANHPNWVFSHFSAAQAYGLYVGFHLYSPIHLRADYHARSARFERHFIPSEDYEIVSGLKVTSLLQTLFDCARSARFDDALAIADSGLATSDLSKDELIEYTKRTWHGHKGIRKALEVFSHADPRSESGGESLARALMIRCGFELPDLQIEIQDPLSPSRTYRVDFLWELQDGRRVAGEFDGNLKYTDAQFMNGHTAEEILIEEREREMLLNAAGLSVLRIKYKHLKSPDFFARLLNQFGIPRTNTPLIPR